jgi:hypothetical protein
MRDLNKAERLASSAQEPPTSQATETASSPRVGQCCENGRFGDNHECHHVCAAPSVTGTQPTLTVEQLYEIGCAYKKKIADKKIEENRAHELTNWELELIRGIHEWLTSRSGAAQGTPQVEDAVKAIAQYSRFWRQLRTRTMRKDARQCLSFASFCQT